MYRFIESIQLNQGQFKRLDFHQARMNEVRKLFFPSKDSINLTGYLNNTDFPCDGLLKCRIVYDSEIRLVEFIPYSKREIHTLKLVNSDIESYPYKPENRTGYNLAFEQRANCDDVIIVRNGLLTDSSYCNIALFDGNCWVTPRTPLIHGVNRAELLVNKKIQEKDISVDDLKNYTQIALFNAMIEFGEIILETNKIQR